MAGQLFRYGIIGLVNTGLDFSLYAVLTRGFSFWRQHYLLANALTFCLIVTWSFFWNKYWTFKSHDTRHSLQYTKFIAITLVGVGMAEIILYVGVSVFLIQDMVAKIIAIPFIALWNFFMCRVWAFRSSAERSADA